MGSLETGLNLGDCVDNIHIVLGNKIVVVCHCFLLGQSSLLSIYLLDLFPGCGAYYPYACWIRLLFFFKRSAKVSQELSLPVVYGPQLQKNNKNVLSGKSQAFYPISRQSSHIIFTNDISPKHHRKYTSKLINRIYTNPCLIATTPLLRSLYQVPRNFFKCKCFFFSLNFLMIAMRVIWLQILRVLN